MFFEEPLFQSDIFKVILRNLHYYFTYHNWGIYFFFALVYLYLFYKVLYNNIKKQKLYCFPSVSYHFSFQSKENLFALSIFLIALLVYSFFLFTNETSLFNNTDTMSINTTKIFLNGVTPYFGLKDRLSPLAFWDVNFVYAFTHNFHVINVYIFAQTLLLLFLIYKFSDFIPCSQRLLLLSLILTLPGYVWVNNIVYPERMALIFIFLSFIYLKKFARSSQPPQLWCFILLMNFAIYTKETIILIYLGIFLALILFAVWQEKISLASFIHPFRTMRKLPSETLIFLSFVIYLTFYFFTVSSFTDGAYTSLRTAALPKLIYFYKIEIAIGLLVLMMLVKSIYKFKNLNCSVITGGIALGIICFIMAVVFWLKLKPIFYSYENKTFYLVIPAVLGLWYCTSQMKNNILFRILSVLALFIFLISDLNIWKREQGSYYRETADFILNNMNSYTNETKIFIEGNEVSSFWEAKSWSSAFKYYAPNQLIIFKTPTLDNSQFSDILILDAINKSSQIFHIMAGAKKPQKGDYYLYKKHANFELNPIVKENKKSKKIFENKYFEIYKVLK